MSACLACETPIPDGGRFCPVCGTPADEPTATAGETIAVPRSSTPSRRISSSTPLPASGVYAPGATILDRYRIVGLLGRGGMGEVYRADDLTLGQPVALKFLPEAVADSPDRRDRFYNEVRVARQVAHPNVCRVYDIGDVDGVAFLSMEFVDGEDLASLLRRIGRLPQEKAVEIARQLCAGLGALHDRGVLHRDLKPANVMVDGRGRVRITDFGLSALADELGGDVRVGTPAYMSPEQLSGEGVDERSDLYALGLTLYELFTGKPAFEADTLGEMTRLHREGTPTSPSSILPELEPAVERVIARCLEKHPVERPPSAIAVAAALPGGDPLAAALAAGEIPSLEMVAAAGERGGVRPVVGFACVGAVVVALVLYALFNAQRKVTAYDPMEKPPAVLVDRAQEILHELGHELPVGDTAHGFSADDPMLSWLEREDDSPGRWDRIRDARPAGVVFWYRQSPRTLLPRRPTGFVQLDDPPVTVPDMAVVMTDTRGRLLELEVVPPEREEDDGAARPAEWGPVLAAAGLDAAVLERVEPAWVPPSYADERVAWRGTFPEEPGLEMRWEAAAFRGRPTSFRTVGPWTRSTETAQEELDPFERYGEIFLLGVITIVLFGGVFLALRNIRLHRGDLKSARRLSLVLLGINGVRWALTASHTSDFNDELNLFLVGVALQLLLASIVWCFYLALEPYVRKWWPDQIVAWSRILTGRFRDPLVGRDILVGGVFFLFLTLPDFLHVVVAQSGGRPLAAPTGFALQFPSFLGTTGMLGMLLISFVNAILFGMFFLLWILFLRFLFRGQRAALAAFALVVAGVYLLGEMGEGGIPWLGTAVGLVTGAGFAFVLFRFGLVPFIFGFFLRNVTMHFPVTLDGAAWYSSSSIFAIVVILGFTVYGLHTALAGKSVFRDWLLED